MKWRLLRGNTFTYGKIPPQEPPLHARSSSIPRIHNFKTTAIMDAKRLKLYASFFLISLDETTS